MSFKTRSAAERAEASPGKQQDPASKRQKTTVASGSKLETASETKIAETGNPQDLFSSTISEFQGISLATAPPSRLMAQSHPLYGWNLVIPTPDDKEGRSDSGNGKGNAPREDVAPPVKELGDLPIRTTAESQGDVPSGALLKKKTFDGFIRKLDSSNEHCTPGYKASSHANNEESYLPELLVGSTIGGGSLWHVLDGELRLPLVNGVDPIIDPDDPIPSDSEVRAMMIPIINRSRRGIFSVLRHMVDKEAATEVVEPDPAEKVPPMMTRIPVAIKLACPASAARAWRPRLPTPDDDSEDGYSQDSDFDPDYVLDESWRGSEEEIEKRILKEAKLYSTNLKSLQGKYVPKFYGLWTFDLKHGRVYMMVQEILARPEAETVRINRLHKPVERAICRAYTAKHNANIIKKHNHRDDLFVREHPTTFIRRMMEDTETGSSRILKPKAPVILKLLNFDEAVDISELPLEEREAAILHEKEAVGKSYDFPMETWDEAEKIGEEDLWTGRKTNYEAWQSSDDSDDYQSSED